MTGTLSTALTFAAALGSGLMAGLFFAFSNSVMPALGRVTPAQGIETMNHINTIIQNPLFFAAFMGTALLAVLLAIAALMGWTGRPIFVIAGAIAYLAGNFAVTVAINVPMNNALAAAAPDTAQAAQFWATYLDRWVMWNHVRAVACTAAMAAFIAALM